MREIKGTNKELLHQSKLFEDLGDTAERLLDKENAN